MVHQAWLGATDINHCGSHAAMLAMLPWQTAARHCCQSPGSPALSSAWGPLAVVQSEPCWVVLVACDGAESCRRSFFCMMSTPTTAALHQILILGPYEPIRPCNQYHTGSNPSAGSREPIAGLEKNRRRRQAKAPPTTPNRVVTVHAGFQLRSELRAPVRDVERLLGQMGP